MTIEELANKYKTWNDVMEAYLKNEITTDELLELMNWYNVV